MIGIIEIGSNNTKTHIYENDKLVFEESKTIEFKKHYLELGKIDENDWIKLDDMMQTALKKTKHIHVFGCSIFRILPQEEIERINQDFKRKYQTEIEIVTQEDEAHLTAFGCYSTISFSKPLCIFIGGGGSTELIFVKDKKIFSKKYYDFGVVDITKKFESLKEDVASCTFDEVYQYIEKQIGEIKEQAEVIVLAGGNHIYWYQNAGYKLFENTLYKSENQPFMITSEQSDFYDRDALVTSLDTIRANSDNPVWFDGSRAMKVMTNLIMHKVGAKYVVPTKINMEDGLLNKLEKEEKKDEKIGK